ncbi:MAG: radical SAM protein [candidate division KSB1 bacterium]|nr:radical SAM protein [candidate division KSB1 bacterium]
MIYKIPKPISGGLILSYKCNARCRHCMYACSPKWSHDWPSEKELTTILAQLAKYIRPSPYGPELVSVNHGLHFTGGEPFMNFNLLCQAVEIAHALGIPSLFVETNCFWCVNDEITKEKLQILKAKGLHGILISVNPFYLEFIPFERTERGINIAAEIFGRNLMVYQLEYYRRFKKYGITGRVKFQNYLRLEKEEDVFRSVEFFLMGRASYDLEATLERYFAKFPANAFFEQPCSPPLLRNWHNHFDNYGNFIPGYCGGISLGDCRDLQRLLVEGIDTNEYPVLKFLLEDDFEGFFRFAEDFGYRALPGGYFTKCHLCTDIRKYLVMKHDFTELRPKEFYEHLS